MADGSGDLEHLLSSSPGSAEWTLACDRIRGIPDRTRFESDWTELHDRFVADHRPAGLLLSELLQAGDPVAWTEFARRWRPFFQALLRRKFPRLAREVGGDCLDEVLGELAMRIGRYEPGPQSSFKAWLVTVARNLMVDFGRRNLDWGKRRRPLEDDVADLREHEEPSVGDEPGWDRFVHDFHALGSGWTRLAWHLKYGFEERDPLDRQEEGERGKRSGLEPAPFFRALPPPRKGVRASKVLGGLLRCAELTINTAVHRMTRVLRDAGYPMRVAGGTA